MLENLLNKCGIHLENRISRTQYQRNLGVIFSAMAVLAIAGCFLYATSEISNMIILSIWWILVSIVSILAFCIFFLFIGVSILGIVGRLHDMNRSGWWFFLGYIPFVGIIQQMFFMFADGDKDENSFGPVIKDKKVPFDKGVRIFGIVGYFIFIVLVFLSSTISGSNESKYTPSKLASEVAELNKSINLEDTDDPHIIKYSSEGLKMTTYLQYNDVASEYDFSNVRENLIKGICSNTTTKKALDQGIITQYIYTDSENKVVTNETITKSDCKI